MVNYDGEMLLLLQRLVVQILRVMLVWLVEMSWGSSPGEVYEG